jgi:hypothetical protein
MVVSLCSPRVHITVPKSARLRRHRPKWVDYGSELAGAEATVRGDQGLAMAATRFVNFF